MARIVADPEVMRFVDEGEPLARDVAALWIERSRENVARFGYGTGAVVERDSRRMVGWAGFARPEGEPEEIVYGFERAAWGKGYGSEVMRRLVEYAFGPLGLKELRATIAPCNAASIRIIERLCFVHTPWEHDAESLLYVLVYPSPVATPAERLQALHRGENPRLVARVPSGWVEMAPFQFRRGYCLLLADPIVASLNDAPPDVQAQFLMDMARLGDAVRAATGAVRCNYSIYGNLDPFLHAHVVPRFLDEPVDERTVPPLNLPIEVRENPAFAFDTESERELIERIREGLGQVSSLTPNPSLISHNP